MWCYGCDSFSLIKNASQYEIDLTEFDEKIWRVDTGNVITKLGVCIATGYYLISRIDLTSDLKLVIGEKIKLLRSFDYKFYTVEKNPKDLIFKSSDTSVVQIDDEGNVKALKKEKQLLPYFLGVLMNL